MTETTNASSRLVVPFDGAAVASAIEDVRLAEGQLERRRHQECGPRASTREALRLIAEHADEGAPITPSQLAEQLQISSPSVSHIVKRLSQHGLISTIASDNDRRSKVLVPMDRHFDTDTIDPLNRAIRDVADGLSPTEAATVTTFLASVRALIDAECR